MLSTVNSTLRRQRRRTATLLAVLVLAGTVVAAHSVLNHDHMGDAVATCLAVVETAVVAVGTTLALAAYAPRLRFVPLPTTPARDWIDTRTGGNARAGPQLLQVFRL